MKYIQYVIWLSCFFTADVYSHRYVVVGQPNTKYVTQRQKRHLFKSVGCQLTDEMLIKKPKIMQNIYSTSYYKTNKEGLNAWSEKYGCCVCTKKSAPMYLKYVSPVVGYGVFAAAPLKKGDFIGMYSGELRCWCDGKKNEPDDVDYAWFYPTNAVNGKRIVVDAKFKGNELRFINHASCQNTRRIYVIVDGILYICYIAGRDIYKDEQLTVDYGAEYWQSRSINPENVA